MGLVYSKPEGQHGIRLQGNHGIFREVPHDMWETWHYLPTEPCTASVEAAKEEGILVGDLSPNISDTDWAEAARDLEMTWIYGEAENIVETLYILGGTCR